MTKFRRLQHRSEAGGEAGKPVCLFCGKPISVGAEGGVPLLFLCASCSAATEVRTYGDGAPTERTLARVPAVEPAAVRARIASIEHVLGSQRFPLGRELGLQDAIATAFLRTGLVFEREKRLGPDDILDFFVPMQVDPSPPVMHMPEGGRAADLLSADLSPGVLAQVEAPPSWTVPGIAVEVKINGSRRDIYRQCERYCVHPEVVGLVLATVRAGALPATIAGKPALVVSLGRAWL